MKLFRTIALSGWALVGASLTLHAQSGCLHSPEAPTDVLLMVGAAGMFYGSSAVRGWIGRRRQR